MPIELAKETKEQLLGSLKRYFREELEVELSELRGKLLLDFLLQEVAPVGYNCGVRDAEAYMRARVEDLPGSCFAPELTHWAKRPKR